MGRKSKPWIKLTDTGEDYLIEIVGTPTSGKLVRDSVHVPYGISREELDIVVEDMVVTNFPNRVRPERVEAHKRRMEASYGTE